MLAGWALEKSLMEGVDEVRKAVLVCAWDEKDEGVLWVSRSWLGREGCWGPASSLVKLAAFCDAGARRSARSWR